MIYTLDAGSASGYELIFYESQSGRCPVLEMFSAMPAKHEAKALKFLALLKERGPDLPRPYADTLRGKIRELVVDIQHHGYRFLYFFSGKTIVTTHGFLKKTPQTPAEEISRAERYMDDWLRRAQP